MADMTGICDGSDRKPDGRDACEPRLEPKTQNQYPTAGLGSGPAVSAEMIRDGIEKLVGQESADTSRYAYVDGWLDRAIPFVFEVYHQAVLADAGAVVYIGNTELTVEIDPDLPRGALQFGRPT